MDLANTPFFGLLRARLDQLSERQQLIAENIANASTPGYRPRDVDTAGFERMLASAAGGRGLGMSRTNAMHMAPNGGSGEVRVVTRDDSETTIDGNAVVLEEQMARAAETRMAFETGIALYQKGLELVRMAARAPGR
ncbi:MAG TPA: flagellar basal body rod protein FlgB [Vitreimonas sp.]|uniref:flagellar basal body rod protein FlgB n=1 Tax=Vitreimonas sp. TaxID=3069702 RepID=UPI002D42071A|nr:flagellar basal body rod protein FlgB [Vitreimonas sp.]HYD89094.1 flagellar basal body rod protein FlgB [Vitreimonas sp.]